MPGSRVRVPPFPPKSRTCYAHPQTCTRACLGRSILYLDRPVGHLDDRADLGGRGPAVPTCTEEVQYFRFIGHISANISAKPVELNLYRPYIGHVDSYRPTLGPLAGCARGS